MTLPTNLFIDAPEVEDISMTHLSNDATEWPEEIISKLKERVPAVANMSLSVKMMHADEESGAATGSVTITNGQKTAVVPVVIKEFSMFPLDIVLCEGKILPLTNDNFASIFLPGTESAFGPLDEFPALTQIDRYLRGESLQNAMFPPNWGRYAFASEGHTEGKKYPVLSSIVNTIDGSELAKAANEDPGAYARFYSSDHFPLVEKLANTKPVNMGEFRQGIDNLIMRTIHVLTKDSPNKYTLLSTSPKHFSPAISSFDRSAASDFCSTVCAKPHSVLHDVDQNGEKVLLVEDKDGDEIFVARPFTNEIVEAKNYGHYNVRSNRTGVNVEGVVIPTVINFDQEVTGNKIFLGKTLSTIQTEIWGTKMDGMTEWQPCSCPPGVGQTGTFVYRKGEKGAVATVPVTIKSVHTECPTQVMKIKAVDLFGQELNLSVSKDMELQRIAKLKEVKADGSEKNYYLIPGKMEWIPMEVFDPISESALQYAVKTAGEKLTGNPIVLLDRGFSQYGIRGLDKYANHLGWENDLMPSYQAKFLMASVGMSSEKIAEAMKYAKIHGKAEIHGINYPEIVDTEKVAAAVVERPALTSFINEKLKANLFKVASYVENAQTVDSLLSLNFVNPDNVSKFVNKIPLFKAALSNLAACLLASRIGIREIPEQSTMSAIAKLGEVIKGLEILRTTQQPAVNK